LSCKRQLRLPFCFFASLIDFILYFFFDVCIL
jgi:hypothetical protein